MVYIVFDSDIATNVQVARAAAKLFAHLSTMGAKPHIVTLRGDGVSKVGLDDFLKAGGSPAELYSLAKAEPPSFQSRDAEVSIPHYESDGNGIVKIILTKDGPVKIQITNFSARIVSETLFQKGSEISRELEIAASVKGQESLIMVPAEEFERTNWTIPRLGADAITYSGIRAKDDVRVAIQLLSPNIRKLVGIQRTGWHCVNGKHFYVHSGGVICGTNLKEADSAIEDRPILNPNQPESLELAEGQGTIPTTIEDSLGIRLRIPSSLKRYSFPSPSSESQLVADLNDSMQLLELAPHHISFSIYTAIWLAAVGHPDFSIHIYGITGTFKSEFAALATQHFGAEHDARNLPGSWSSTTNYIRAMSAFIGNAILTVDDFVPTGSQSDIEKSNRAAEDVFRGQGNGAGRGRCHRDGTPQEPESPKCLILSTGEVRPSGQSLTSRVITLEVNPSDIADRNNEAAMSLLTQSQEAARTGAFERLTAAYIEWIAADYEYHQRVLEERSKECRNYFSSAARHARTIDAIGKLMAGLDRFLVFAVHKCQLSEDHCRRTWQNAEVAFLKVMELQDQEQSDESPVTRFLELIKTALATGRAHLLYLDPPSEKNTEFGLPKYFGYQEYVVRTKRKSEGGSKREKNVAGSLEDSDDVEEEAFEEKTVFNPQGQRIGWKHLDNLYFEPSESLAMAQRLAKDMNQPPIPLNAKALGKRLAAQGLLASCKPGRNLARKYIDGRKLDVFHLRLHDFMELIRWEDDLPDEQDEKMFAEHQQAIERESRLAELMKLRKEELHEFKQQQFIKLLNPDQTE